MQEFVHEVWILTVLTFQGGDLSPLYPLCDLAKQHLLQKTCWVDFTLGSPDWTVRVNASTVRITATHGYDCDKHN